MSRFIHHVHGFDRGHQDETPANVASPLPIAQETDDPRNTLLDAFEQFVEALVDNDLGLQARLRFERHIPPLVGASDAHTASAPSALEGADDAAKSEAQAAFAAAGPLGLSALLTELKRLEKLKMNALAHQAVQAVKGAADTALADLMAGADAGGHPERQQGRGKADG